jgi:uncharacterized protein with HEPN domain
MSEKNDLVFIEHILDSIGAIEEFSKGMSKAELKASRLRQSAIVREIEVIGEAAKNVSRMNKEKFKEIPWRDIAGTRDKMIHHYFGVDLDIVWNIVRHDLPTLKRQMIVIRGSIQ